eukprot:942398-Lingulodinium_polyedra.AAC.1
MVTTNGRFHAHAEGVTGFCRMVSWLATTTISAAPMCPGVIETRAQRPRPPPTHYTHKFGNRS